MFVLVSCIQSAEAASPFAGFYVGQVYTSISGNVSVPERPIGGVAFTINADGAITSLGDLSGTVSDGGAIAWNPNSTGFATGTIADGVISSTTSVDHDGTISHFRIEAKNSGPGIGEGNALAGRFTQANPTKALRSMNRIRFVDDRFLAVGNGGAFATSYDGINWTRVGVPTVLSLYDVAYGNGHYVVVGDSGARFWSTNGIDWVSNPAGAGPVAAVAFGNGQFAMITFAGAVSVSPDGVAWAPAGSLGAALGYSGLDFVNGEFVAWTGDQISFSADAGSWNAKSGSTGVGNITVNLAIHTKVAFGNGVYIVAGQQGLAYSSNGTTWTPAFKAPGVPFGNSASVTFGNGKFVVCDTADNLWISTDGQQWTRVDQIELHSLAYGAGRYVGVGDSLWSSIDGVLWIFTQQDELRADNREPGYVDPYAETDIVGVFSEGSSGSYSYGRNGYISWFKGNFPGGSGVPRQLTTETLRYAMNFQFVQAPVIVGNHGTMIVADDRQTVTFQLIPPVTSADLVHGAKGDNILVFVGTQGAIVYTKDPQRTNWVVASSGTSALLKHVAWYPQFKTSQPNLFVAVGEGGVLLTSPDGTSWTRRDTGLTVDLAGSAFDGETRRFLVAGADGTLLESLDGAAWTRRAPIPVPSTLRYFRNVDPNLGNTSIEGGGDNGLFITLLPSTSQIPQAGQFTMGSPAAFYYSRLNGATLGNGRFLVAGAKVSAVSTDGEHWSSRTNSFEAVGVAFGNGKFVAVGTGRVLGVSGDGLRWNLRTNVLARDFRAITYGGGRFVAVGDNGAAAFSPDGVNWTDTSISSQVDYNDIIWNNGTFIAGGTSGTVLLSTNGGQTWTEKPTFLPEIKGITFGDGKYVAVALDGWSATSSDGLQWEKKQYPYISPVESRPAFSEVAFAAGTFYAPSTRGEIYTSTDGLNWQRKFTGAGLALKGAVVGNGAMLFLAENEIYLLRVPDIGSPVITQNPVSTTVNEDGSLTLLAAASGAGAHYTWLKDGLPLDNDLRFTGADSSKLTISPFLAEDAGRYEFTASNDYGTRTSAPATISLNPKALITAQPESSIQALGSKTTLSVAAMGDGLTYQWFRNGAAIAGATASALEIASLSAADAGDYYVEITNPVGVRASHHAAVSVVSVASGYGADAGWPAAPEMNPLSTTAMALQPDGKLIVAGFIQVNGVTKSLVRINPDGSLDSSFTADLVNNQIRAIHVLADGKILIGGFFQTVGGLPRIGLARLNPDGKLDTTFTANIASGSAVYVFRSRADGKIWMGGSFGQFLRSNVKYLALLAADGTPDTAYTPPVLKDYILAIHVNADESILVGGGNVSNRGLLTKILPNNTVDTSFPAGGNGPAAFGGSISSPSVQAIVAAPGGGFYIGGQFNYYNNQPRAFLARILANGELDTTFVPQTSANSPGNVRTLGLLGENLLIGGDLYEYAGTTNSQFLILTDSAGAVPANPKMPKLSDLVLELLVQPDNSIIVRGEFQTVDGQPKIRLARLVEGGGSELGLNIVQQPRSQILKPGVEASLAVAATGKGALSFQWRKNGEALDGETKATLLLSKPAPEDAGAYTVEVKDSSGTIISQAAVLSFQQPSTGGGFTEWAAGFALPPGLSGLSDDADGDGYSNAAEFAFGTNPAEGGSKPRLDAQSVTSGGQNFPAVSYIRNKNAVGVSVEIKASSSVTFNAPADVIEVTPAEDLGNGLERVTVRSATAAPHTFFFQVKTLGN